MPELLVSIILAGTATAREINQSLIDTPQRPSSGLWADGAPGNCPFPKSETLGGLEFTGRHAEYTDADTWYFSWALDDKLYTPFADGSVNQIPAGSGYFHVKQLTPFKEKVKREQGIDIEPPFTGYAVVEGSDPLNLKIARAGYIPHQPFPYGAQYPCGSLVYNGVWYYGSYYADWNKNPWDIMGPFSGFNISTNLGQTWEYPVWTPTNNMFGENGKNGAPVLMWGKTNEYDRWEGRQGTPGAQVKIGAPHFVDFGKNMQHSPDGKAYLVAQGSTRPEAYNSWAASDQVYLLRVTPGLDTMNNPKAYEFYAGRDANDQPVWSGDFKQIKPLLEWNGRMGVVTVTYMPLLKTYLMCVTAGHGPKGDGNGPYDTYILESDVMTGPWRRVTYMKEFGAQAYFVNFPSKFIQPDGRTMWLCYAHGWSYGKAKPPASRYALCLQEVRLLKPAEVKAAERMGSTTILDAPENVALSAEISVSSFAKKCWPSGIKNGVISSYHGNEWAVENQSTGAWVRLTWKTPQTVDRVWLFDRCDTAKLQVLESELRFSDGSIIKAGELPDDGAKGRQIAFPAKTITWLEVRITRTRTNAANIGLSEVAVFRAQNP
jgi:hypothetical protein